MTFLWLEGVLFAERLDGSNESGRVAHVVHTALETDTDHAAALTDGFKG